MANEIERKFLVRGDAWRTGARSERFRQGYISTETGRTVRVRIGGAQAYVTIKGERQGLSRLEFEYNIPVADAEQMLDALCQKPLIEKTRHFVEANGMLWEVDEFAGENAGLVLAEVELEHADQAITLPNWVGEEVTEDARYYNSNLVRRPYSTWHTKRNLN
jgi:CYTH domain-containing protein